MWFFISHQAITDMPFVAPMTAAFAFVLLGVTTNRERVAKLFEIEIGPLRFRLSAYHAVVGAILLIAIPQIFYLFSKNVSFNIDPRWGLRAPPIIAVHDAFMSGSPGNCGLPGNEACLQAFPVMPRLQPAVQALIWVQAIALLLYVNWGERRVRRLYYLTAWLFAGIATMGKGPAGIVIPVGAILAALVATRRYEELLEMEILSGCLIFAVVALPWFVAMVARHGGPFVDRLIFHDMYARAFEHVHDTNQGEDVSFRYFLWQLGYATFPWVGFAPLAVVHSWRRPDSERSDARRFARATITLWALLGFALFSLIETKFHHYIFPIVPAVAMLIGLYVDGLFGEPQIAHDRRAPYRVAMGGACAFLGAGLVVLVGRDFATSRPDRPSAARLIQLFSYNYERAWPENVDLSTGFWAFAFVAAAVLLFATVATMRRYAVAALGVVAAVFTAFCLDDYFMKAAPHWGQRETALAYLHENQTNPGPIISYQQNWKGENFYFGNHIASFPSTGQPFRDYVAEQRRKHVKYLYFFAIPNHVGTLHQELDRPRELVTLTPLTLNNKFVLVRATL